MAADKSTSGKSKATAEDRPEVTHDLQLEDGTTVESSGGIPSHVAVGDKTLRVVRVTER